MLPKESLEKWNVHNCSECDALNKALNNGADVKNLELHTVKIDKKTGQISDFAPCKNCQITTKDVKNTTEGAENTTNPNRPHMSETDMRM